MVLVPLVVQFGLKRCCASRYNADNVSLGHIIVAFCLGFALVLAIHAILLPHKRQRIIIPAAALSLLGVYELKMDHWEKTVRAPIRLDLFFEIPLVVAFTLWGVLASWALSQMQSLRPRDTFAAAGLSEKESREIVEAVEQSPYDTPDSWNKELRVKQVELGAAPGLVVQGSNLLCGATGNCQTWIFRKATDKWVSMFDSEQAPLAESFQLGPAVTQGIKDLTLVANSSAKAGQRVTYKFDGKFYQAKQHDGAPD